MDACTAQPKMNSHSQILRYGQNNKVSTNNKLTKNSATTSLGFDFIVAAEPPVCSCCCCFIDGTSVPVYILYCRLSDFKITILIQYLANKQTIHMQLQGFGSIVVAEPPESARTAAAAVGWMELKN